MSNYTITIEDNLYRRIPKNNPYCWKEVNGKKFPSSANFKTNKNEDGLSVNIAALIVPDAIARRFPNNGIAEFSASVPMGEGFNCIQKGKDASHAIIEGDTNPIAKKLAKAIIQVYSI